MNDTPDALDLVHGALQALKDNRHGAIHASAASLARLAGTKGGTKAVSAGVAKPVSGLGGRDGLSGQAKPAAMTPAATPRIAEAAPAAAPSPIFTGADGATQIAPTTGTKTERLAAMRGPVLACQQCPKLVASRKQVVFGVGNPEAELMFVGEAPGADEDLVGEPFVGKAGQLLTKIIEAMALRRDDVYIANVLKCRPDMPAGESGNRKPTTAEMDVCKPYLLEQINIIQPKVIVALGATAVEGLLGEALPITRVRGQWKQFHGIPLMLTFHPAYLLRNQSVAEKRKVWEDMLQVMEKLGHPISAKQQGFFLPRS